MNPNKKYLESSGNEYALFLEYSRESRGNLLKSVFVSSQRQLICQRPTMQCIGLTWELSGFSFWWPAERLILPKPYQRIKLELQQYIVFYISISFGDKKNESQPLMTFG